MRSLADIKDKLESIKLALMQKYSIKYLAIFGSYSRNQQHPQSDVDVLVDFEENIGIRFIDLAEDLENHLGVKVDLISRKGIKDKYFEAIKSELIYV